MNLITNNLGSLTRELLSTEIRCEPETAQEVCSEAGIPYTGAGLLVAAIWLKAFKGDVNAAKLIREMNGESNDTDNAVDLSAMSDAALLALARGTSDASAICAALRAADFSAAESLLNDGSSDESNHILNRRQIDEPDDEGDCLPDGIPW